MLKNKSNYEIKFINKIILKNKIIDQDKFFEIGYCEELKIYMIKRKKKVVNIEV